MSLHNVVSRTRHSVDVDCTVLLNALRVASLNAQYGLFFHSLLCVNLQTSNMNRYEGLVSGITPCFELMS